jgi:predicted Zn-dependent protease with MMP-like domain
MDRARFEKLVDDAIAELPRPFLEKLQNVCVIVEDYPSQELLERMGVADDSVLLGLYEGTPLTERGFEAPLFPDRIWIFQRPIEQESGSEAGIKEEIQTTIKHEVAHFFGLDDDELEEMGY